MTEPINWYSKLPAELRKKYHNPGFEKHGLEVPFRMAVIGASGSGKTNFCLNLLKITSGTFQHVLICLKSIEEPLYQFLKKKLRDKVTFCENEIPPMDDLKEYESSIVIFDDLVASRNLQATISDWFIRGRKFGISMVYISQAYYAIPKLIRLQCQYVVLKKVGSDKDLALILREFSFGISKEQLMELYERATKKKDNFLLVDLNADGIQKYRLNWKPLAPA